MKLLVILCKILPNLKKSSSVKPLTRYNSYLVWRGQWLVYSPSITGGEGAVDGILTQYNWRGGGSGWYTHPV